jgi:hypothetical protein
VTPATRVTVFEVEERTRRGEPFVFVDARNRGDWDESQVRLPGAIRAPVGEGLSHW